MGTGPEAVEPARQPVKYLGRIQGADTDPRIRSINKGTSSARRYS
jgi:hypothetical protein